jgi:hypothetical protein
MLLVSRGLATIGMVMIFWPNDLVEVAGFLVILLVLGINLAKRRREQRALREAASPTG